MRKIKEILKNKTNTNINIIKNIIGAFTVKGAGLLISIFTMPAYMRYFHDQKVLGIWFTIISVLNWVLMFDLGLGNGLRNKLPYELERKNYLEAKKYISSTYITTIIFVIIIAVLGQIVIPILNWNNMLNIGTDIISETILKKSIKIVFCGILIQFIFKIITSILYAMQKSAVVNLLSFISNLLILISISIAPNISLEKNLILMSIINLFAINIPLMIATIIIFNTSLKDMKPDIKNFSFKYGKRILGIGVTLLWLQIIFMVISSTNEFLISILTSPDNVVEYQAYNKVFNIVGSLFVLGLTPIWSAVTKAQSEQKYVWINKLYNILLLLSIVAVLGEIMVIPFLQYIMDLWLGYSKINVSIPYAIIFAISNWIFIIHNINTSICNGLSYFKVQIIWMTIAAILDIPFAYIGVKITGGWIGIVLANIFALLPYEILQPIYFKRHIKKFIYYKFKSSEIKMTEN